MSRAPGSKRRAGTGRACGVESFGKLVFGGFGFLGFGWVFV